MTRWWWCLVATALLGACGKLAPKPHPRPTNVAGVGGSAAPTGGSAGDGQAGDESIGAGATPGTGGVAGGGLSGSGGAQSGSGPAGGRAGSGPGGRGSSPAGRGGREPSPYEPSNPDEPKEGDGTLLGGSFEGGFGDGWDGCGSKHPGMVTVPPMGEPSDGARFLLFDSNLTCEGCAQITSDLQLIFWFDSPIPAGEPRYLYFDVVSFSMGHPTGALVFGSVHPPSPDPCTSAERLATVPLSDLATSAEWQTRCVAFTPTEAFSIFGLYVADGNFQIGLDALRFGPPCR